MIEYINNYFWWVLGYDRPDPYTDEPPPISIQKYIDAVNEKRNLLYNYYSQKNELYY